MVPAKGWKSPEMAGDGFPMFSSESVEVINQLNTTETTILLTTSHKSKYTLTEWKAIFIKRGIRFNQLNCLESSSLALSRREEILNWFKSNQVNQPFIIIDDDKSLNDLPKKIKDNLLLTSPFIGLTQSHLDEIKTILKNQLQVA